ncbi:MAG: radical SAM protein [Acidobacteria bacterium]|nr:radical SAM protein [Acidobacteriota bacterium]
MEQWYPEYECCRLCPRQCGVNRNAGQTGFCGETAALRLAWAGLHRGEEPPLCGERGSGTAFFTGCTLRCGFCQNWQISRAGMGREIPPDELVDLFLRLQQAGAATVNLVTGTPFLSALAWAVGVARRRGLQVPVVWNSSGYETEEAVTMLHSFVDIFLPDLKTLDSDLARRHFQAADYPAVVMKALANMASVGPPVWSGTVLRRGLIVRHLVLPGELAATRRVLEFFARELKATALLSLMMQYAPPCPESGPVRRLTESEYATVVDWLAELEIEEGFVQEPDAAAAWLPDFTRDNPFPEEYSDPLWHWRRPDVAAGNGPGAGADSP